MKKIVINKMRGLNTVTAALAMPPMEIPVLQNLRGRPFDNLHKRMGIRPISSQSAPVYSMFEFDFDEIIIPMFSSTSGLTFFPSLSESGGGGGQPDVAAGSGGDGFASTSGISSTEDISFRALPLPDPSPYPMSDPLDPTGSHALVFRVEDMMRATVERRARVAGAAGITWPTRTYDLNGGTYSAPNQAVPTRAQSDFYTGAVGTVQWPPDGFYAGDMLWSDVKLGNPVGTKGAALVNAIRTYMDTGNGNSPVPYYFNNISGATFNLYTNATLYVAGALPAVATTGTYRSRLADFRLAMQLLRGASIGATLTNSTAMSKESLTASNVSFADAKSCVLVHYPTATRGGPVDFYSTGCIFAANVGFTLHASGLRAEVRFPYPSPGYNACFAASSSDIYTPSDTNIKNVREYDWYGTFDKGSMTTYFPPSAFGSPAENDYVFLTSTDSAAQMVLSSTALDQDFTSMVALLTDASATGNNGQMWRFINQACVAYFNFFQNI